MSMTREEAIEILSGLRPGCGPKPVYTESEKCEAFDVAISALTPPTQEQLERVWPGCERCTDPDTAEAWSRWGHQYCHHCGRPITPKAWAEQRKRWEALWSIS